MKSLMLKTGGKCSYQFTVMISATGKLTEFDSMEFYLFGSNLHRDKYSIYSLCDNELSIVVWKMSFKYLNYLCPQAVNEMLKWATCQRRQESERQVFSAPPLWQQEKTDYFLQRSHTATSSSIHMQNNENEINKILSLITKKFCVFHLLYTVAAFTYGICAFKDVSKLKSNFAKLFVLEQSFWHTWWLRYALTGLK